MRIINKHITRCITLLVALQLLNLSIYAQDFKTFEKEYTAVISKCNDCHASMGYGFIKVVKMNAPADNGIAYTGKSKAEDVPK